MESTRIRFGVYASAASGCMLLVGLVFVPLAGRGHPNWATWTSFALIATAGLLGWRAYRLWERLDAELTEPTRTDDPPGKD